MTVSTATLQELLAENRWIHFREQDRFVVDNDNPNNNSLRIVVRVLKNVPREYIDDLKMYLNTRASGANANFGKTVTSPMVNGRALSGTWTHAGLQVREESLGTDRVPTLNLYQTLVQGANYIVYKSVDRFKSVLYEVTISGATEEPTQDTIRALVAAQYPELDTTYDGCISSIDLTQVRFNDDQGVYQGQGSIAVLDPSLAKYEITKRYRELRISTNRGFSNNTYSISNRSSSSQSRSNSYNESNSFSNSNSQSNSTN